MPARGGPAQHWCSFRLLLLLQVRAKVFQLFGGCGSVLLLAAVMMVSCTQHCALISFCTTWLAPHPPAQQGRPLQPHLCYQPPDATPIASATVTALHARVSQSLSTVSPLCVSQDEAATAAHIAGVTGLAVGMVVVSCCLWYYSRRYVGEMALMMPDAQRVRFSVLDFFGNREVRGGVLLCRSPPGGCGRRPPTARRQTHTSLRVPGLAPALLLHTGSFATHA